MRLRYRECRLNDLRSCVPLIRDSPLFSERYRSAAEPMWRRLMEADAMTSVVAEDLGDNGAIVALGMAVFVTPECARQCIADPRPGLAERVLLDSGTPPPVLGPRDIEIANSGRGLYAVTLHHDLAPHVREGEVYFHIARNMMMSWCESHAGFSMNCAIAEGYGEREKAWISNGGTQRIASEYEAYYRSRGEEPPHPSIRPHLVVATREDALERPSGALAGVFLCQPPRFYFGARERRLLERAVLGDTDAQLCNSLGISADAVKKRWAAAYARVLDVDPEFFGRRDGNGRRGPEKRHQLVEYIRQHPEEKRPYLRPSPPAAKSPLDYLAQK